MSTSTLSRFQRETLTQLVSDHQERSDALGVAKSIIIYEFACVKTYDAELAQLDAIHKK